MWPLLLDMSKDDCRRALRSLELETYGHAVSVLRAQGHLGPEKKKLLQDLAYALNIPIERHKAEVRKAVNDEKLNTIAEVLSGPNTGTEWAIEGRRLVPLIPREPPRTVFSLIADQAANIAASENSHLDPPCETASKATECPLIAEPASPEPSKTQIRSQSPPSVVMLPSGTAIQIKRESDNEDKCVKRRRSESQELQQMSPIPVTIKHGVMTSTSQLPMTSRTMAFPTGSTPLKIALPTSSASSRNVQGGSVAAMGSPKVIIVSSASSPGTSSILQKTLSVPIKSVITNQSSASKSPLVYTQSVSQQILSTGLTEAYKVRTKPIVAAASIPKPKTSAVVQSQQGIVIKNQPKQQGTSLYQSGNLKTALQTTKHTVPIQSISGLQLKSSPGGAGGVGQQQTKILVQHKTLPRVVHKTIQQKGGHKSVLPKTTGQQSVQQQQQQKTGQKQAVLTSVQVKTPQGYTNVPIQLRAGKQTNVQVKPETVKMLAISAGAKILPKPSQPVYMVAASTSGLTMVTRSLTSSSSPRVVTVSSPSGGQVRTSQSNMFTSNKPMQTVHVMTQPQRRQNLVLVQKGVSAAGKQQTYSPGVGPGKMLMSKTGQNLATITVQKPPTTLGSTTLAQSLQNLPMAQTQAGNVILLDLSNQESMSKNAAIAELLQASGILSESSLSDKTSSRLLTTSGGEEHVETSTTHLLEEDDDDTGGVGVGKIEQVVTSKTDDVDPNIAPTLSIEEAVEMLNKSDTPETRALLSQAGIQISDEIGDSEEDEEELIEGQVIEVKDEQLVVAGGKKEESSSAQLNPTTTAGVGGASTIYSTVSTPSVVSLTTMTTTPRTMDIFSTALASANINLDNFMEEEDDPEQTLVEVPATTSTATTLAASDMSNVTEQQLDTSIDSSETEHNVSEDTMELQLDDLSSVTGT